MPTTYKPQPEPRAIVMGWFSFELYGATAGDLMVAEVAGRWLERAGIPHDVALAPPFRGGVDWRAVDPQDYTHFVFACGPIRESDVTSEFLARFRHCRKIGLNLSMLHRLEDWNPFDDLIERDSDCAANPDMSLLYSAPKVPVVGLLLVSPQKEYGDRGRHALAKEKIGAVIRQREMAVVRIDTRLDENSTGLRSVAEVESMIARMDAVLTTRLHGTVLALKNGVPAVVVDAIAGGAKVTRQAHVLGWPCCFDAESASIEELSEGLSYCLSPEGRATARNCAITGAERIALLGETLVSNLRTSTPQSSL